MIPTTDQRSLSDLFSLAGRTALVTGGAKGIGRGVALRLAEAGAAIAIVDVDEGAASEAAAAIAAKGGKVRFIRADLTRAAEAAVAVKATVDTFGRIDIVVNNAGIFPMKPAIDLDEATWDRTLDLNLKGAFFIAQAAARAMPSGGSIINMASIDAFHPTGNLAHYDASKGGLVMLTRSLAAEWARSNVRVNGIAPGAIRSPGADLALAAMGGGDAAAVRKAYSERIPLARMGIPDDIALATLFLASDASSYVTGQTLIVDGGLLLI